MDVSTANQLQNKVTRPPAYVTEAHLKKIDKLNKALDKRLSETKIEWLIERFRELSEKDRKKLLSFIGSVYSNRENKMGNLDNGKGKALADIVS